MSTPKSNTETFFATCELYGKDDADNWQITKNTVYDVNEASVPNNEFDKPSAMSPSFTRTRARVNRYFVVRSVSAGSVFHSMPYR